MPTSPGTDPLGQLRPCAVRGCPWRGVCPDHDLERDREIDAELNRLMRARPFGAGRKRQRSPARYETSSVVKSEVVVSSVAERVDRPPRQIRRSRIIHPEPVPPAPCTPAPEPEVEVPNPASMAKLIGAKAAQSEHGQGAPARRDPGPPVTRRRGRRVALATNTPVVHRKRRARRPGSAD